MSRWRLDIPHSLRGWVTGLIRWGQAEIWYWYYYQGISSPTPGTARKVKWWVVIIDHSIFVYRLDLLEGDFHFQVATVSWGEPTVIRVRDCLSWWILTSSSVGRSPSQQITAGEAGEFWVLLDYGPGMCSCVSQHLDTLKLNTSN